MLLYLKDMSVHHLECFHCAQVQCLDRFQGFVMMRNANILIIAAFRKDLPFNASYFFTLPDQAMTNRHFIQMVSVWITLTPSPKNEDGCSCVDRDAHRTILLLWGDISGIYVAYAPGKFMQPAACGSDSGGESSNNPSGLQSSIPKQGHGASQGAQHSPASATTVWMLWEVLRAGSSTPLTPHIRKLSDLCWGVEIVASPVCSGRLLALLQCLQCHHAMQTQKGKSVFSWTSRCQSKQEKENFLFLTAACFTQLHRRILARERNKAVLGKKS